jgi:hypothetical protein
MGDPATFSHFVPCQGQTPLTLYVPKEKLFKSVTEWTRKIKDKGISMEKNWDFAWELITEHVAKAFLVSPDVIEKRVEKDEIKKKYYK